MGPREVVHTQAPAAGAPAAAAPRANCSEHNAKFMTCMKDNSGSVASCQYLMDMLSQCQREEQMQQ